MDLDRHVPKQLQRAIPFPELNETFELPLAPKYASNRSAIRK